MYENGFGTWWSPYELCIWPYIETPCPLKGYSCKCRSRGGGAFLFSKMVPCSKPGGSTCHATTMSDIFSLNSQSVTMSYVSHSIFKSPSFCACDINRRFVRLESKNDCEANLLIYVFEHPIPMVGVLNNMFLYCMQAYVQFRFKQTSHNSSWQ